MTTTVYRAPTTITPPRPSARGYWLSSLLVAGAIVVGVIWALSGWHAYQHDLRRLHRAAAPGPVAVQLSTGGRQVIYYEGPRGSAPFAAADISISDPAGVRVSPHTYSGDARYDVPGQHGQVGRAVASFTPLAAGTYTIRTSTAPSGAALAVGPDVRWRAIPDLVGGLIVIVAGAAGGTVTIALTAARRRRDRQ